MRRACFGALIALAVSSCNAPFDPNPPSITGVISSRVTYILGTEGSTKLDTLPRILVNGAPDPNLRPCFSSATINLTTDTEVLDGGNRSDLSRLVAGVRVSVWGWNAPDGACPPVVVATRVLIQP
jgi:hypothetical protein